MKSLLIAIVVLLSISCSNKENRNEIRSISVVFFNFFYNPIVDVSFEEIVPKVYDNNMIWYNGYNVVNYRAVLDTLIVDSLELFQIRNELNKVVYLEKAQIDPRTKCYINYNTGITDTLYIDQYRNEGLLNNKPIVIPNRLMYLIRKNIDYYRWFNLEELHNYFEELNDSTFSRAKVRALFGEMY